VKERRLADTKSKSHNETRPPPRMLEHGTGGGEILKEGKLTRSKRGMDREKKLTIGGGGGEREKVLYDVIEKKQKGSGGIRAWRSRE